MLILRLKNIFILFLWVLYVTLSIKAFSGQIQIINKLAPPQAEQQIILQADKDNIKFDDPVWGNQILISSADLVYRDQDLFSVKPLSQWEGAKTYPWASVGYKIYLANNDGTPGPYLGYLSFTLHANPKDKSGFLSDAQFSSDGADPNYQFQIQPSVEYIQGSNLSFNISGTLSMAADVSPPIITNAGWSSGMGNDAAVFVPGKSFWIQDYGMDEPGRWTVVDKAIAQSTQNINGNSGSRAYPVIKSSSGNYQGGVGVAYTGLWQIDIKIGSSGAGNFCETFYLSERRNLAPGPANYIDGAPDKSSNVYGREIDIMETKWQPSGPATNLPTGGGTAWNPDGNAKFGLGLMANWSDVGGAPTRQFITFGAYITGDELIDGSQLWLYAYRPSDSANEPPILWYAAGPIPLASDYKQEGPFVPYIGTWGQGNEVFSTEYKNYIYLPAKAMGTAVPDMNDQGKAFWEAIHKAYSAQKN